MRTFRLLPCLFGVATLALCCHQSIASTCADWSRREGPNSQNARIRAGLAYAPSGGGMVMFGGAAPIGSTNPTATLSWNGSVWTTLTLASPPGRESHGITYDSHRGRIVVFGGQGLPDSIDSRGYRDDTWEWDGVAWSTRLVFGPSQRRSPTLTYVPSIQRSVLFGGTGINTQSQLVDLGDCWAWNGLAWEALPGPNPPARARHAATYDEHRQRLVVFGGLGPTGWLDDLWEFDGTTWTQRTWEGPGPARRGYHTMTYDPVLKAVVVIGGRRDSNAVYSDSWSWNGIAWTSYPAVDNDKRSSHAACYDPVRHRLVVVGGFRDGSTPATDIWEARLTGDANGDGLINGADLSVLLANFGASVPLSQSGDLNDDGAVDAADLSVLLASFGTNCLP